MLKFEEFWKELTDRLRKKHDFITLTQEKEFEARNAIDAIVVIPSSTGYKRVIKKDEFRKIWNIAKTYSPEHVYDTSNYQKDSVNTSYILTFAKYIVTEGNLE